MQSAHLEELDRVLLYMSEACQRAAQVAQTLEREGADPDLLEAVEDAERDLSSAYLRLMRRAYFGIPTGQLRLT
ncbi:MAG: hypothetical protein WD689_07615 [Gaiellaceae bacterium]